MSVLIPVSNDLGDYTQKINIGKVVFNMRFRWNGRMGKWLMDISSANNALLISGLPILEGWPITDRFLSVIPGLPWAELVAIDSTGAHRDPDELNFGVDVNLFAVGV